MVENLSLNKWISSTFNNWSELKNETQSVVHQILSNNTRDLEFFEAIKYELEKIYLATWYDYADYDTRLLANETDVKKVINEQVLTWKIKTLYHALLHWKDQKTKNQIKQWLYNDYFYDLWVIFNTNYCKPINENINYSEIKINAKNIISNPLLIKEMNFISFEWFKDENLTKEDENKLLKSLKENTANLKWLSIWRWMIEMNLDFLIELFNSIPNNIDLLNLSWILDSCIINNEEYLINIDKILKLAPYFPHGVKTLYLPYMELINIETKEIINFLNNLPKTLLETNLISPEFFTNRTEEEKEEILNNYPKSIIKHYLWFTLDMKKIDEYIKVNNNIPQNIKSYKLNIINNYEKVAVEEWNNVILSIPRNTIVLDIESIELDKNNSDEITTLIQSLPQNLKKLKINHCWINSFENFLSFIFNLPKQLINLDISWSIDNDLYFSYNEALEIIISLPQNLKTLKWSIWRLFSEDFTLDEVKRLLFLLPISIETLDFENDNQLYKIFKSYSDEQILDFFKNLSTRFKKITLKTYSEVWKNDIIDNTKIPEDIKKLLNLDEEMTFQEHIDQITDMFNESISDEKNNKSKTENKNNELDWDIDNYDFDCGKSSYNKETYQSFIKRISESNITDTPKSELIPTLLDKPKDLIEGIDHSLDLSTKIFYLLNIHRNLDRKIKNQLVFWNMHLDLKLIKEIQKQWLENWMEIEFWITTHFELA